MAELPQRGVLLVDDDTQVLATYSRLLRRGGVDVVAVESGTAALAQVAANAFQAVVADISMPGMDGIELFRRIREIDLDVPLLLITGAPNLETAVRGIELGVLRYLTKASDESDLVRNVQEAVKLGRMARLKRAALALSEPSAGAFGDLVSLETVFNSALSTLWLAYQPIVSLKAHAVFGYEALVRTREPRVPHPGVLFDTAERLSRVEDLGERIRALVPSAVTEMPDDVTVFVNLHPRDLNVDSLYAEQSVLTPLAGRVVLEITERASLHGVRDLPKKIARLRELGFRIALDDLGAGYAGLSSFVSLSPDVTKIDMSLVRDIDKNPVKQQVFHALVQLCREMNLAVVAEGVETAAELSVVREMGCDLIQGYLFAKPGPPLPGVNWPQGAA